MKKDRFKLVYGVNEIEGHAKVWGLLFKNLKKSIFFRNLKCMVTKFGDKNSHIN